MTASADQDGLLGQLMEEFLERKRRGEHPSLTEMVERLPDHEKEIRELWPALIMLEQAEPSGPQTDASVSRTKIGDYRIIREIGRGGMGVVYEAEQESLARRVALKVLPDPGRSSSRQRFLREARVAARLHHTNIVPVFHIGEEDGLNYYAMQYIHGCGMEEVLEDVRRLKAGEFSGSKHSLRGVARSLISESVDRSTDKAVPQSNATRLLQTTELALGDTTARDDSSNSDENHSATFYYRSIASLGVQVADALAYAHQNNVIHRDIKPSNLLLDQQGTTWVSDFGLVYTNDSDLTGTGDLVGTVRYMAPERFEGTSIAESDIYALGLTLYELLTLEYPFRTNDRAKLIKLVTTTEVPSARAFVPDLPKDLDTIVRKPHAC